MKLLPLLAIILVAVTSNAQWKQEDFAPLQKLTGTWMMSLKNGQLFEVWTLTDGNTLTSKSYRVRGSDTASLETVVLSLAENRITYTPTSRTSHDHNRSINMQNRFSLAFIQIFQVIMHPAKIRLRAEPL